MDSVPDVGPMGRADRRRSSRGATYAEQSMAARKIENCSLIRVFYCLRPYCVVAQLRKYATCLSTKEFEGFAAYSEWAHRSHEPTPPLFVCVFIGLLPDHRELSDYEAEEWIAFPTPSQRVEQIDGALPALRLT